MIRLEALQVAEIFNLKQIKQNIGLRLQSGGSYEQFYVLGKDSFVFILHYGVIVFANVSAKRKEEILLTIKDFATNWLSSPFQEEFVVEQDEGVKKPAVTASTLLLPADYDLALAMRLTMLNTGQSVALDFYEQLTYQVLHETQLYTREMEKHGRIKGSKKNLLRFIGKALNIKNSIVDNLYILDDPNIVWDDPEADRINKGLKETFDIHVRFRDLDYKLRIVEENLKLFTDVLQHKESSRLEWIIIILILIEVVNMFWREVL